MRVDAPGGRPQEHQCSSKLPRWWQGGQAALRILTRIAHTSLPSCRWEQSSARAGRVTERSNKLYKKQEEKPKDYTSGRQGSRVLLGGIKRLYNCLARASPRNGPLARRDRVKVTSREARRRFIVDDDAYSLERAWFGCSPGLQ